MSILRILMLWLLLGISSIQAQQYSYSSGSDFFSEQFQVHVSIGQVFGSVQVPDQLMNEGVLSVLSELLFLENKASLDYSIQISPNPFSNDIKIVAHVEPWVKGQVEIYTNQGVLVDTFQMSESTHRITLGYLPSGLYLVRVCILGRVDYVQKIIKLN